jgi:hypothetical protein
MRIGSSVSFAAVPGPPAGLALAQALAQHAQLMMKLKCRKCGHGWTIG